MDKAETTERAHPGFSEAFCIVLYSILLKYEQTQSQKNAQQVQVLCCPQKGSNKNEISIQSIYNLQ